MSSSICLIHGDDEYAVSLKAKDVVKGMLRPEEQGMGLEVVDATVDTADAAASALLSCAQELKSMGLLSATKLVWLKNANFLGTEGVLSKAVATKEAVQVLADTIREGFAPGAALLITSGKVDRRSALFKVCEEKGVVHEFTFSDKPWQGKSQAAAKARQLFREAGLDLAEEALDVFVETAGHDGRQMVSEIEKLRLYRHPATTVRSEDIRAVGSFSAEVLAWDLADAFGRRELSRAIDILNQLVTQKESPIGLIMLLMSRIRDLMLYREAMDKGWLHESRSRGGTTVEWKALSPEVEKQYAGGLSRDPRKVHPFRAGILASQARLFSMRELKSAQERIMQLHRRMVSSQVSPVLALESFLVKMLA